MIMVIHCYIVVNQMIKLVVFLGIILGFAMIFTGVIMLDLNTEFDKTAITMIAMGAIMDVVLSFVLLGIFIEDSI